MSFNMWRVNPLMRLVLSRLNRGKRKTRLQEPSRSIEQWTIGTFRVDNVIKLKSEIIWTGDLGSANLHVKRLLRSRWTSWAYCYAFIKEYT